MKYLSFLKLSCLALMIGLVVSCGSATNQQNDDTNNSTSAFFDASTGGQMIYSAVDSENRTLITIHPETFDINFSSTADLAEAYVDVYQNGNFRMDDREVQSDYSSTTGYVQFYLTDVNVGDDISVNVICPQINASYSAYLRADRSVIAYADGIYASTLEVDENDSGDVTLSPGAGSCTSGCDDDEPGESYPGERWCDLGFTQYCQ